MQHMGDVGIAKRLPYSLFLQVIWVLESSTYVKIVNSKQEVKQWEVKEERM